MELRRNQSSIGRQTGNFRRADLSAIRKVFFRYEKRSRSQSCWSGYERRGVFGGANPSYERTVYSGSRSRPARVSYQAFARSSKSSRSLEIDILFHRDITFIVQMSFEMDSLRALAVAFAVAFATAFEQALA